MDFSLSGHYLKTFARSITCLARIGHELSIEATPSKLSLTTINSSRSSHLSVVYKPDFFDAYTVSADQAQCSLLLKAVCAVLRTPIASIDRLQMNLPDSDASRTCWALDCTSGMKKTYWIACNVEPDVQQLTLDEGRFTSNLIVTPRDVNSLLSNFQSSLQEITIIATEPSSVPSDAASEVGGKAVEIRSYMDPTKDNDSSLHTQLWIDPVEEFVQYNHSGNPVDVTFGLKELKAFSSFCEGCEVDIHIFFEKAGEPVLMRPRVGLDDGRSLEFDATLVLATMLTSQLQAAGNEAARPQTEADKPRHQSVEAEVDARQTPKANVSAHSSDYTRIWSDLSAKSATGSGSRNRQGEGEMNINRNDERDIQRFSNMNISKTTHLQQNQAGGANMYPLCQPFSKVLQEYLTDSWHPRKRSQMEAAVKGPEHQGIRDGEGQQSQRHLSNWVDAEDADEEDDTEDNELCVQSTPPYCE